MCAVYIYYVYINTNTCMYTLKKNVYILNTLIYNNMYTYILKIYTVCVCIYIYINSTHTYIMLIKTFNLDVINRLTALFSLLFYCH